MSRSSAVSRQTKRREATSGFADDAIRQIRLQANCWAHNLRCDRTMAKMTTVAPIRLAIGCIGQKQQTGMVCIPPPKPIGLWAFISGMLWRLFVIFHAGVFSQDSGTFFKSRLAVKSHLQILP